MGTAESTNPINTLHDHLQSDMESVNRLILQRMESPVPLIEQVAAYLIAAGGKRIRPLLTLASTALYEGDMARAHLLAACVEFIHSATLLHDDVVDGSNERRGQKTANLAFGNPASVLVGDFLFARAFELMTESGSLEILRILSRSSSIITQGEVLQLSVAGNIDTSMDTYIEIITGKTAALFSAACEVGPVIAEADKEQQRAMKKFGLNLGIAFQITDDVLDYAADQNKLGKAIGDDFREGKMTAPVIFALQSANEEERTFWARAIKQKNHEDKDLKRALEIIHRYDGIEKGLDLAGTYAGRAGDALKTMPDVPMRGYLENLLAYMMRRDC